MKHRLLLYLFMLMPVATGAQQRSASDDFEFVGYLLGNGLEADAATLLFHTDYAGSDTLDYLKGWVSYSRKDLQTAARHFGKVPYGSAFYDKSAFFEAVCDAHLGRYDEAEKTLDIWERSCGNISPTLSDCCCLVRSGIALLDGRPEDFRRYSALYSTRTAFIQENFNALESIYRDSFCTRPVTAPVAAALSAVIPGAGQFYAGDKAKGILTFLLEGAAAAVVVEQYRHYGLRDWRTMAWAGLGLTLHAINIYGATVSVSIRNEELADKRSTAVLYNIHIPLRTVLR